MVKRRTREPVRWVGLALNAAVAVQAAVAGHLDASSVLLAGLIAALTELAREKVTPT